MSELTWFEKGLRRKWVTIPLYALYVLSELTWFEKGLRLSDSRRIRRISSEWIDLIWEGITTLAPDSHRYQYDFEWIDLIWEWITTRYVCLSNGVPVINEWIDLIWEGITTDSNGIEYPG